MISILKQYWGYDHFRGIQQDIIESISAGRDTLGLMPTGGGKSITFQVPALAMEGVCIVITPLIALMKDQVQRLRRLGIRATAIYSGMSRQETLVALDNCVLGGIKLLYVSPERLASEQFQVKLRHMHVSFITVDEAHCISQWGYDFRPSYLEIANIRKLLPGVPILALTATATPRVIDDIQEQLQFQQKNVFKMSFERKNLAYIVRHTSDKQAQLLHILNAVPGSAIVYVRSRRRSKEIADYLNSQLYDPSAKQKPATYYHAGLDHSVRDDRQTDWQQDKVRVMVATNAFGMGIDKPDVRLVIHMDCPSSIEAYFQEAGRAGRDGKKAYAVMLYRPDGLQRDFIGGAEGIFGSCEFYPVVNGLVGAGREAIEGVLVLFGIFIYLVDVAEIGIVGMLQMGRYEQEGIAKIGKHLIGDVLIVQHDGEIVNGRHVALFGLHGLRINECPRAVGIVVERELLLPAIFFHDEGGLELRLGSTLGNLHPLGDAGTDVIGAEIERGQRVEAPQAGNDDEKNGVVDDNPLVRLRDEPHHLQRPPSHDRSASQQHEVLQQRLSVGEFQRVAEASAVLNGVGHEEPRRDKRHHHHQGQRQPRSQSALNGEEQENAQAEFQRRQRHRTAQRQPVGSKRSHASRLCVVMQLILRAQRVDSFHVAREDKRCRQHQPAHVHGNSLYTDSLHLLPIIIRPT